MVGCWHIEQKIRKNENSSKTNQFPQMRRSQCQRRAHTVPSSNQLSISSPTCREGLSKSSDGIQSKIWTYKFFSQFNMSSIIEQFRI